MTTSVEALMQRLEERTTERNYHMRVSDALAARIKALEAALRDIMKVIEDREWDEAPPQAFEIARAALAPETEK